MKKKWLLPIFASFMLFTTTHIDSAEAATKTEVTDTASKYLGIPYKYGGTTTSGFDCSGFTSQVFADLGITLNRTSGAQYQQGTAVAKSDLQVGDLLFFNTSGKGVSHVSIYIGDGKMIHSQTNQGVSYSNVNDPYYWGSRYIGAKRVATFDEEQQAEVKKVAIDFTVYASRAEAASQIAKALNLDTSDKNSGFVDIKPTYEHAGAIAAVAKLGIFEGDASGKFNPSSPITRAQIAKVLVIAFGLENAGQEVTFSDVPQDSWANQYVSILASNGVTNGDGNGSFGMDELLKIKELKMFIERLQSR
ncbi:peptidase [Lysinibacillus sp. KCTC 33748]|uniref:C40 family peptidase n=1 Tax=unclassified Lysinibacillus TaxID=2636778 RepID=UPI0009A7E005|nr:MULTISPECIES: C40 family peptidase [unclassified Lysinibacillus]OXS76997.1 peptidase [Lysinibacillus sp. KCTC 33748]SKB28699.1 S-layer homology domain-containing protein [Lysinibacillus sp. AC-3]